MEAGSITLILFATFSSLRIVSYLPQIYKVATDKNGASAISYATWTLWTGANVATALYAFVNLNDLWLAAVSAVYAGCCIIVISLTAIQRRRCARHVSSGGATRDYAATDVHSEGTSGTDKPRSVGVLNTLGVIGAIRASRSNPRIDPGTWPLQASRARAPDAGRTRL